MKGAREVAKVSQTGERAREWRRERVRAISCRREGCVRWVERVG